MYFIIQNCLLVSIYNFVKDMNFGGLLTTIDYAIYMNVVSRREFVIVLFNTLNQIR